MGEVRQPPVTNGFNFHFTGLVKLDDPVAKIKFFTVEDLVEFVFLFLIHSE